MERHNISMSEELWQRLREAAQERRRPISVCLAQAVIWWLVLSEHRRNGVKLLIDDGKGNQTPLILS